MAHVFDAIVPERLTQANNRHSLNEVTSPSATTQQNALRTSPKIDTPQPEADSAIYLQPQSWDPMISGIQTDNFSTTMDDLFSFLGPPLESNGHDLLQGFLDQSTTPSAGPEVYPPTPRDSAQQSPGEDKSVSSLESSYPKDTLSALSRLNHFLTECHLLLQNQSCPPPWRISMPYLNLPNDSKLDENPVGLLLRSTAEFIDIVRTWTKSTSKQPTESEKTKDRVSSTNFWHMHPAKYTLNKPTILMIITTYLLFIRMFDVIFSRLTFALQEFPHEAANVRCEPGLQLGGFSLPQGFLYMKIIIQAFEHQFELMDNALGLPAEYRISACGNLSERQHDPPGVFENPRYRSLLKSVVIEGLEDDDQEDDTAEPDNHNAALRLREKLAKIKELLQNL
uniref:Uncharacterized protein n=1 Tax=Talaromyces marneffei PM1 TaxID=1077442 RepID=A0A093VFA2_TALMA